MEANFNGQNGTPTIASEAATSTDSGYEVYERQDLYFYTFGPKLTLPLPKGFAVFGHFLVGGIHGHEGYTDCSIPAGGGACTTVDTASGRGNGFAFKTGGGLDWNHGHWGIRIAEVDYVHPSANVSESEDSVVSHFSLSANDAEVSTGITYTFWGKKPAPPPPIQPPVASCSLQPTSVVQGSNGMVTINATASDPQNFPLTYSWQASAGTVEGNGPQVRWLPGEAAPGTYTVTATVDNGHGRTAECSASPAVTARVYRPPTVTLTSDRDTVLVGEAVHFTANGQSPDNLPLTYSWQANCGQLAPTGTTATMNTNGVAPGTCTATVRVQDNHGGAADASKGVNIQAPPPPPQASKLNSCDFAPAASSRVDNVCKRILDDVGLRLQNDPRATIVIIGYATPGQRNGDRIAGDRAQHTADYLAGKGVDRSRMSQRTGTPQAGESSSRIDIIYVPEGATY